MLSEIYERIKQKKRTIPFPSEHVTLSDRYRGQPTLNPTPNCVHCQACQKACPVKAISFSFSEEKKVDQKIDLGRCVFCLECVQVCPVKAINFSNTKYQLATSTREDLKIGPEEELKLASALDAKMKKVFGRSLKLREVSAGGCNACEADVNVLGTLAFDLGRFGIQMVASPRHADGILVTGPISKNMELALSKTYQAVPSPKIVIAVGSCAISGGVYADSPQVVKGGLGSMFPVDLYVPGCPPHPLTILDGLLRLLDRMV